MAPEACVRASVLLCDSAPPVTPRPAGQTYGMANCLFSFYSRARGAAAAAVKIRLPAE